MIAHKEHFHGSDLEKIEKYYGISKDEIISFAANVNPLGLSDKLKRELSEHLDVLTKYPDREYTELRQTIATYCKSELDFVAVGNGSTELISLIIKAVCPAKALIIGPTYSEYEHEVGLSGGISEYFLLKEEEDFVLDENKLISVLDSDRLSSSSSFGMLIICNPNNPTSGAIKIDKLERIVSACRERGIFVLIDETYVEFATNYDEICAIPLTNTFDNLAIIRGISKFFAAPGLRLGYAITSSAAIKATILASQNAWSINSLAETAGRLMFSDTEFIQKTRKLIYSERDRMLDELSKIPNIKCYPASANFILVKILDSSADADIMFENAIMQKMMIRNCNTFTSFDNSYFRFCIMMPEDNTRLLQCIKDTVGV